MPLVWRRFNVILKFIFILWCRLFNCSIDTRQYETNSWSHHEYVVIGAFLDTFSIYDKIITYVGGGALVPITSFGHLLIHGAMEKASGLGFIGLLMGMFDLTASGITSAIIFTFFFSLFFKPKD